jgi:hypothetical protein
MIRRRGISKNSRNRKGLRAGDCTNLSIRERNLAPYKGCGKEKVSTMIHTAQTDFRERRGRAQKIGEEPILFYLYTPTHLHESH